MIKDIFVPSRIGSYYIFNKRVLGFELNATSVQASLLYFAGNKVVIENSMSITLQDQTQASVVNAIKKIAATIGSYNEVVTSLTTSAVIFKELILPFIGREKIKMILAYEVEPLLPFSLDEAVIDFIITEENKEKSQSTILVAATRQVDIENQAIYFEKAGIKLDNITLDMFALYDFYTHLDYISQVNTSLLLIDFSIDVIRILYIQQGVLKSVRLVPYGLAAMMSKIDDGTTSIMQQRILDNLLQYNGQEKQDGMNQDVAEKIITDFCKQISLSISFFQKHVIDFIIPSKIVCVGVGAEIPKFEEKTFESCRIPVDILDVKKIILKNNLIIHKKAKIDARYTPSLIIALSAGHYGDINLLSHKQNIVKNSLLNRQLITMLAISCIAIAGIYFYSQYQLSIWNFEYDKSKKEISTRLKSQMDLDTKSIKRINDIVSAAQAKLEQSKKVCFSFSQSNHSFLRYLQDLSSTIDRVSLGLDLKKISMHDKEVVLQGKVKDFEALETFTEELMELKRFTLKDKPGELAFSVNLYAKDDQDGV